MSHVANTITVGVTHPAFPAGTTAAVWEHHLGLALVVAPAGVAAVPENLARRGTVSLDWTADAGAGWFTASELGLIQMVLNRGGMLRLVCFAPRDARWLLKRLQQGGP